MKTIVFNDTRHPFQDKILIDDEDYAKVSKLKWGPLKDKGGCYARTYIKGKLVLMHRLIMGNPEGMDIDHRNGNRLDNRRCNLRICTRSQNIMNSSLSSANKSGYKGVSWDRMTKSWRASIMKDGKAINLGRYFCLIKAAKAYDDTASDLFGEFANLNFNGA